MNSNLKFDNEMKDLAMCVYKGFVILHLLKNQKHLLQDYIVQTSNI